MQHPAIDRLQSLSSLTFTPTRKGGYDAGEIDRYLEQIRAVTAELAAIEPPPPPPPVAPPPPPEPSEEVLRVLQLAEASGAQVVREAEIQANAIRAEARADAERLTADTVRELQAARRDLERLRAAATETRESVDRQLRESASAARSILQQAVTTLGGVSFAQVNLPDLPVTETVLDRMAVAPIPAPDQPAEEEDSPPASPSAATPDLPGEAGQGEESEPEVPDPEPEIDLPPPAFEGVDEASEAELDEKFQKFWNNEPDLADKWRISPDA